MESFNTDRFSGRAGDASDALDLIAQAETETYLPSEPEHQRQPPTAAKVLVGVGGVFALASALWIQSNLEGWWAIPLSAVIVGVFVAFGVSIEKKVYDVKPKALMPVHVWKQAMKQQLPMIVGIGLLTPTLLLATETPRSFGFLMIAAALYLAALVAIVWGFRRWRSA